MWLVSSYETPVFQSSTSDAFERSAVFDSAAVALPVQRRRSFPVLLIPALLLGLVLGRILSLGFSMRGAETVAVADAPSPLPWEQMDAQPAASYDVEDALRIAHGAIAGTVIGTAICVDPDATRQLPPPATFMSDDDMPLQLLTTDFTTDAAVCSRMARPDTAGRYRFDFHDGGLSAGEVYDFLTFVTQGYRPVSLCDQRLRLPLPLQWPPPDFRYVAR